MSVGPDRVKHLAEQIMTIKDMNDYAALHSSVDKDGTVLPNGRVKNLVIDLCRRCLPFSSVDPEKAKLNLLQKIVLGHSKVISTNSGIPEVFDRVLMSKPLPDMPKIDGVCTKLMQGVKTLIKGSEDVNELRMRLGSLESSIQKDSKMPAEAGGPRISDLDREVLKEKIKGIKVLIADKEFDNVQGELDKLGTADACMTLRKRVEAAIAPEISEYMDSNKLSQLTGMIQEIGDLEQIYSGYESSLQEVLGRYEAFSTSLDEAANMGVVNQVVSQMNRETSALLSQVGGEIPHDRINSEASKIVAKANEVSLRLLGDKVSDVEGRVLEFKRSDIENPKKEISDLASSIGYTRSAINKNKHLNTEQKETLLVQLDSASIKVNELKVEDKVERLATRADDIKSLGQAKGLILSANQILQDPQVRVIERDHIASVGDSVKKANVWVTEHINSRLEIVENSGGRSRIELNKLKAEFNNIKGSLTDEVRGRLEGKIAEAEGRVIATLTLGIQTEIDAVKLTKFSGPPENIAQIEEWISNLGDQIHVLENLEKKCDQNSLPYPSGLETKLIPAKATLKVLDVDRKLRELELRTSDPTRLSEIHRNKTEMKYFLGEAKYLARVLNRDDERLKLGASNVSYLNSWVTGAVGNLSSRSEKVMTDLQKKVSEEQDPIPMIGMFLILAGMFSSINKRQSS